jgi:hypothetical protein
MYGHVIRKYKEDPLEGVTALGTIETGAGPDRIPAVFQPVLDTACVAVSTADHSSSLYLYGSVATGMARPGESDVDLLTIGVASLTASAIARSLSRRSRDFCRSVEVAALHPGDLQGDGDEAYGNRVFLRHYCVHLAGPDLHATLPDYAADVPVQRRHR